MRLGINDRRLRFAKIYLDGERKKFVIEADDERGYIERYEVDEYGALIFRDGRVQVVRESGDVQIVFED